MTTEEALKIAENPMGGHGLGGNGVQNACDALRVLADALREAQTRTYDDGVRDAAKAVRDQAIRTFGKLSAVADQYARVVEALLSPAPAVAPVAAPKPGPAACADCGAPAVHLDVKNRLHAAPCCGSQRCCFFGCMGYATRPLDAPDEKPVAFDAEAALLAFRAAFTNDPFLTNAIDKALAAGRGAR